MLRRKQRATCAHCGRSLDEHRRDVQFRLPQPVLDLPEREQSPGIWMTDEDPAQAVMMQVPNVGPFVRCLLPVQLSGGYSVTFGVWLSVPPEVLEHVRAVWWEDDYADLVIDGRLANRLPVFGLLGAPAQATVVDPNAKPVVTTSTDARLAEVLTQEFAHEELLGALPPL